jgi:DNA-binding transcriptional regulator PaaX
VQTWLHLLYKIPRNPTSRRVYVWRKLKRLGALLLHDSVWCLPSTPRTLEHFQWLVVEIEELGGEAMLWQSQLILGEKNETLIQKFQEQVNVDYGEILSELSEEKQDLSALSKKYQQIKMKDYFQSELGKQVEQALLSARGGKSG